MIGCGPLMGGRDSSPIQLAHNLLDQIVWPVARIGCTHGSIVVAHENMSAALS